MDSIFTINEIDETAVWFLKIIKDKKLFAFHGDMGAGKTTFIGSICKQLKIEENISSPTYSIINEYHTLDGENIFHLDLYRLLNAQEVIDAGVEDCLFSGNYCFVEWPERAEGILPAETIHCYLQSIDDKTRKLVINL